MRRFSESLIFRNGWRLVGQEYTRFEQRPERQADAWAYFQQLLGRTKPLGGDIRRSLAKKYVVGMSPGYHRETRRLGGRVDPSWGRARVNAWRNRFITRRPVVSHPAGFAQYNFTDANAAFDATLDAIKAIDFGLSRIAR